MRVRAFAAAAAAVAVVPFGALVGAAAGAVPAQAAELTPVTVLHLIPIDAVSVVDVVVDGVLAVDDLEFEALDEAQLAPGAHLVEVYPSTWSDDGDADPVLSQTFTVGATPLTVVAQLSAAGAPALVAYTDDLSATEAGKARLTVRHAASAPAVDVAVNGTPDVVSALANGAQASLETPAGSYDVETSIAPDGPVVPDLSADDLPLVAGVAYVVYAYSVPGECPVEVATHRDAKHSCLCGLALFVDSVEVGEKTATTAPATTAPATTPSTAPTSTAAATTTARIPTAVPAGAGTSGWSGPLGAPVLALIGVGALIALGAAAAVHRGATGSHR